MNLNAVFVSLPPPLLLLLFLTVMTAVSVESSVAGADFEPIIYDGIGGDGCRKFGACTA